MKKSMEQATSNSDGQSTSTDQQNTKIALTNSDGVEEESRSQIDEVVATESNSLRTTLAIGELLASNRPTAGNRLIANELRNLSMTLKHESNEIRRQLDRLATDVTVSLKSILEEDREQRNIAASGANRRLGFGNFSGRRFPVYRRPRRIPLQFARKSVANASTNTPSTSAASTTPTNEPQPSAQSVDSHTAAKQAPAPASTDPTAKTSKGVAAKSTEPASASTASGLPNPMKSLSRLFKNPWFVSTADRSSSSYDGEADTELSDSLSSPSTSP